MKVQKYCSLESNCNLINKSPKHNEVHVAQSKFSLNEIRSLILERNSLQNQIKYLEKQLFKKLKKDEKKENLDRKESKKKELPNDQFSTDNFKHLIHKKDRNHNEIKRSSPDQDLPVQGPMPKEPDEKLYFNLNRRSSSAFLKLYAFFIYIISMVYYMIIIN